MYCFLYHPRLASHFSIWTHPLLDAFRLKSGIVSLSRVRSVKIWFDAVRIIDTRNCIFEPWYQPSLKIFLQGALFFCIFLWPFCLCYSLLVMSKNVPLPLNRSFGYAQAMHNMFYWIMHQFWRGYPHSDCLILFEFLYVFVNAFHRINWFSLLWA